MADDILQSNRKFEVVSEGVEKPVHVWRMSAGRRIEFEAMLDKSTPAEAAVFLFAACVGDETGPKGYTLEQAKEADSALVHAVAAVAWRINALSAEAAEGVRKNS